MTSNQQMLKEVRIISIVITLAQVLSRTKQKNEEYTHRKSSPNPTLVIK